MDAVKQMLGENGWIPLLLTGLGAAIGVATGYGALGAIFFAGAGLLGGGVFHQLTKPQPVTQEALDDAVAKRGNYKPHHRFFSQVYNESLSTADTTLSSAISIDNAAEHDSDRGNVTQKIAAHNQLFTQNKNGVQQLEKKLEINSKIAPKDFYAAVLNNTSSRIKNLKTELEPISGNWGLNDKIEDAMAALKNNDFASAQAAAKSIARYTSGTNESKYQAMAAKFVELVSLLEVYDETWKARETCATNCTAAAAEKKAREEVDKVAVDAPAQSTPNTQLPATPRIQSPSRLSRQ